MGDGEDVEGLRWAGLVGLRGYAHTKTESILKKVSVWIQSIQHTGANLHEF
jgi:hypothetical protein